MKKRNHDSFKSYSLEKLKDHAFALEYLNAALIDDDQRVFLLALKNVLEAQGCDISSIAEYTQLSRQNLYRILSEKGNPKLTSIRSLLHVMGLELAIQPYRK